MKRRNKKSDGNILTAFLQSAVSAKPKEAPREGERDGKAAHKTSLRKVFQQLADARRAPLPSASGMSKAIESLAFRCHLELIFPIAASLFTCCTGGRGSAGAKTVRTLLAICKWPRRIGSRKSLASPARTRSLRTPRRSGSRV